MNDTWEIRGLNAKGGYTLTVFNRWENVVYTTRNYQNDWAATSNFSSNPLPDGTYFYWIAWDDDTPPLSGYIFIKRNQNL